MVIIHLGINDIQMGTPVGSIMNNIANFERFLEIERPTTKIIFSNPVHNGKLNQDRSVLDLIRSLERYRNTHDSSRKTLRPEERKLHHPDMRSRIMSGNAVPTRTSSSLSERDSIVVIACTVSSGSTSSSLFIAVIACTVSSGSTSSTLFADPFYCLVSYLYRSVDLLIP